MGESIEDFLEDFQNRQIHRRLDPSVLASIPDDDVELAIVDYVHTKLDGRQADEVEIVASLPAGIRAVYVTWCVESEVYNGGFNQFFWNSSGRLAGAAVAAFEFFSAHKHAEIMREAIRVRAEEVAAIAELKRKGTLEAFSDSYQVSQLGPLDDRFYSIDDNLSVRRIAKIRAEPELFSASNGRVGCAMILSWASVLAWSC